MKGNKSVWMCPENSGAPWTKKEEVNFEKTTILYFMEVLIRTMMWCGLEIVRTTMWCGLDIVRTTA